MDKSSSLGMPMSPQEISKRYKRQSLGMPWAYPSSSTKYQVIFQDAIFLLLHMLCVVLGASSFLFLVFFCFVCCNQLGCILAFLCGREIHSVLIAQNTLVFTPIVPRVFYFCQYCVQLLFFTHILFRACQFALFMFEQLSGLFCLLSMGVILIKLVGVGSKKKKVSCVQ